MRRRLRPVASAVQRVLDTGPLMVGGGPARDVATVALDDLDGPPPAVIKIDVEGYEVEVLRGAAGLLERERPVVICELHASNAAFVAFMADQGYRVENLDGRSPWSRPGPCTRWPCPADG